jgi:hypothetical protein
LTRDEALEAGEIFSRFQCEKVEQPAGCCHASILQITPEKSPLAG